MAAADIHPRRADVRQRTTLGNRFRFLVRALGLTGLLALPVGWVLAGESLPPVSTWNLEQTPAALQELARGDAGIVPQIGVIVLAVAAAAVALWVLVELLGGLFLVTGRKTAVGTNAAVQIALAGLLLVIVNAISFGTYRRFDLTRDGQFTLAPGLVEELQKLRADSPTTVVVLQLHKTAGTLSDKPDAYDYAAERKVVEKVQDLVGQLREFGPRFNVVVLDVEDEGYERKVRELTRTRPGLAEAIASAPENSIFFYADEKVRQQPRAEAEKLAVGTGPRPAVAPDPADAGRALVYPGSVTRLSFTEFYQLDKTASKEATPAERARLAPLAGGLAYAPGVRGKGNLVLIPRGNEAFVRKVLALEERRPRVGLAVIHPLLTSRENYDEYTAGGLRRTLEVNGFDVVDVILKRWGRGAGPTPAAYTYEESELDRVESRYNLLNLLSADRELVVKQLAELRGQVDRLPLADLDRMFARQVGQRITTEEDRRLIRRIVDANVELRREELAEFNKQLADVGAQYRELLRNDRAAENRRVTDVAAKLRQYVADCDVLIVPRLTVVDIARGDIIPPSLFDLSKEQAEVVKEFLKAGKPVLFAMGPTNVDRPGFAPEPAGDDVEKLVGQLGVELGRQTILTDVEGQAIAERQNEALGSSVDVPPLVFDLPEKGDKDPNPVASAFRVTARAVDRKLDVRESGFRPVYVSAAVAERLPYAAEIMHTVRESWNEERPLGDGDTLPKFDPARPDDPKRGTRDEERRGPFPVGVAIETRVPADWYDPAAGAAGAALGAHYPLAALGLAYDGGLYAAGLALAAEQVKRPTVRVVVLGHGGLFTGKQLEPGHETLLLHCLNWQLGRGDRLPVNVPDAEKWRYPRVDLTPREFSIWWMATLFGLPMLVAYFGIIALMVRKVR